jgi:uncharacterized protein DUF6069
MQVSGKEVIEVVVMSRSESRSSFGRLVTAGAIAAVIAAVADVVVYSIGRASGVSMVIPFQWGQPPAVLPISVVVLTVVVAAILATVTFGLLVRFTLNGVRTFQIVSVPALLLSFGGPLSLAQTDGSTKATLMAMHIVAAAGIVTALSLLGRPMQSR